MDDQTKTAFASASDTSKQLITLATGVLALEITFAKDIVGRLDETARWLIGGSWVLLVVSIVAGVWTLLALTGSLAQATAPTPQSIFGGNVKRPAIAQILLFLGGMALTVWFGVRWVV